MNAPLKWKIENIIYLQEDPTVLTNDKVRVTTKTSTDVALTQEWTRVIK